jgi:hypothetical protein
MWLCSQLWRLAPPLPTPPERVKAEEWTYLSQPVQSSQFLKSAKQGYFYFYEMFIIHLRSYKKG